MIHLTCDQPISAHGNHAFVDDDDIDLSAHLEEDRKCQHCWQAVYEDVSGWVHEDDDKPNCEDEDTTAAPAPQAPGNWVGFKTDTAAGETSVYISVGDPRGAFSFTLQRFHNRDTGEEELRLHLPHPGQDFAHMTLEELHPGAYRVTP